MRLQARVIVSPACMSGEEKDQDRAGWHEPSATACVCDGVSTSPESAAAAKLGVQFSPALFMGNPSDRSDVARRLHVLCDQLISNRLARRQHAISRRKQNGTPLETMLQQVAEESLARSYQTTLAAVHMLRQENGILATVVRCGDASVTMYDGDGVPLFCSPPRSGESTIPSAEERPPCGHRSYYFGPGSVLLVRNLGYVARSRSLQRAAGIRPTSASRWTVCRPVTQHVLPDEAARLNGEWNRHVVAPEDVILIPSFLIGSHASNSEGEYLKIAYSQSIRVVRASPTPCEKRPAGPRTNVTCVLPDHRDEKYWSHFQETLPGNGHVVVASDGFTDCFETPDEVFAWLKRNQAILEDPQKQEKLLQDLHTHLQRSRGDDDISFVWVRSEPASDVE